MRKYQTFVLALSFALTVAHVIDAAPRNRRRARRAAAQSQSTTKSYTPNNAVYRQPVVSSTYTVIPPAQLPAQPSSSHSDWHAIAAPTATAATMAPGSSPAEVVVESAVEKTEPRTLDVGDPLPSDPGSPTETTLARASYEIPVNAAASVSVPVTTYTSPQTPMHAAAPVGFSIGNTATYGGAIAEVNSIRARRGLPPFVEDPSLSAVAYQKASIQANRGAMGHPGGSMGGARFEGVGMGREFTSCYLYSTGGQYAGAASVPGRNGQRYHCLLVR